MANKMNLIDESLDNEKGRIEEVLIKNEIKEEVEEQSPVSDENNERFNYQDENLLTSSTETVVQNCLPEKAFYKMNEQILNTKLVKEVEKRPVLYNFKLPGYSRKDETGIAWSEVGKAVNMTVPECKERWKNLRAVFVRNMKLSKSGAGTKPKTTYYLIEAMQFTVPYIRALGAPSGNLPKPPQQEEEGEQSEEFVYESNNTDQDLTTETILPFQEPTSSPQTVLPPSPQIVLPPSSQTLLPPSSQTLAPTSLPKKRRALNNEAVDNAFIEYLQTKQKKASSSSDSANRDPKAEALKMFLLSMLPDLLKMSDAQVRQFKRKIIDAVEEILSPPSIISPQAESRSSTPSLSELPKLTHM